MCPQQLLDVKKNRFFSKYFIVLQYFYLLVYKKKHIYIIFCFVFIYITNLSAKMGSLKLKAGAKIIVFPSLLTNLVCLKLSRSDLFQW